MALFTPIAPPLATEGSSAGVSEGVVKAPPSAWYALVVLIIATVLGAVDKVVLTLLTEPVRLSLSLSDTQIGLLQGAGLVLFTGIATLPLGWLSDRYDRRVVLAACVVLWSAATGLRGTAEGYGVLFIASIGLGVGEAGLTPITNSMIPDLFPRAQRVFANAVFALSIIFGSALGALLGGSVVNLTDELRHLLPVSMQGYEAWRLTFFVMAAAGIPVALLVLSIRGGRGGKGKAASVSFDTVTPANAIGFREHLVGNWRTFAGLVIGFGLGAVGLSSIGTWLPVVAAREFGATPAEVGRGIGLAFLTGTLVGGALGVLVMRFAQRRMGPAAALRIIMLGNLSAALLSVLMLFMRSSTDVFMLLALLVVPLISGAVLLPNVLQDAAPAHLRARTIALLTMASLPFGVMGPLTVGLLSDSLKGSVSGNSLATAVVITTLVGGVLGAMVLRATEGRFARLMQAAQTTA
ncbi:MULTISPECIES: MFS transporter [unclassified Variovorax]|uniref:MFS transporter n=1 Tax=unclassified Variovorax TaxID=663243 RepID=UPI001601C7EC|nr:MULTISPECIES: MFS transporter [unclassified Variovorax]MBB1602942.1 hypothetical protein [Variovorax sp. UMC13]MDM0091448.1 MFS transporter [Variovorax sp. J22G40]MDM0149646.1 MFS transporter [Variovorax sp. J2P1-31]